jgi:hypothetical protein
MQPRIISFWKGSGTPGNLIALPAWYSSDGTMTTERYLCNWQLLSRLQKTPRKLMITDLSFTL